MASRSARGQWVNVSHFYLASQHNSNISGNSWQAAFFIALEISTDRILLHNSRYDHSCQIIINQPYLMICLQHWSVTHAYLCDSWWCHDMETLSTLLAFLRFPSQMASNVSFVVSIYKLLNNQIAMISYKPSIYHILWDTFKQFE